MIAAARIFIVCSDFLQVVQDAIAEFAGVERAVNQPKVSPA